MKTLMKFGAVAAVALACGAASADYLYALVDGAYYYYNGEHPEFDYLTVKVDGGERYFYGYDESTDEMVALGAASGTRMLSDPNDKSSSYGAPNGAGFYIDIGDGSHEYQTFLFEMFNNDNAVERVAWQEFTYADVAGHVFSTDADRAAVDPLVVSRVVPEPTSALLSLFGLAALALRRRKMA